MLINEKLSILYKDWQQKHPGHFVAGGVVDEDMYEGSDAKILFLFKEVNDTAQQENWSLVQLMHDQINSLKFYRIWAIVGIWIFGMQQGFPPYKKLIPSHPASITDGLLSIATTNLKKTGGAGQSNPEEIKEHARLNKVLWMKEIEIMNPDIVICGGTFSIIQEILGFEVTECDSGANIGKYEDRIFIDFNHPMYRISPKLFYAYFKETMQTLGY